MDCTFKPGKDAPETVVRWVNLYQDEDGSFWACVDVLSTNPIFSERVARTRVVLTPGQFDADPYTRGWNEALDAVAGAYVAQPLASVLDIIAALGKPSNV